MFAGVECVCRAWCRRVLLGACTWARTPTRIPLRRRRWSWKPSPTTRRRCKWRCCCKRAWPCTRCPTPIFSPSVASPSRTTRPPSSSTPTRVTLISRGASKSPIFCVGNLLTFAFFCYQVPTAVPAVRWRGRFVPLADHSAAGGHGHPDQRRPPLSAQKADRPQRYCSAQLCVSTTHNFYVCLILMWIFFIFAELTAVWGYKSLTTP